MNKSPFFDKNFDENILEITTLAPEAAPLLDGLCEVLLMSGGCEHLRSE
jgi:hypothetical protein